LLGLIGRNRERLSAVAGKCRALGAAVEEMALDVTDRAAMSEALPAFDRRHPVDLVIANAGISPPTRTESDLAAMDEVLATNLAGALNTIAPLLEAMRARRHGQIALMGSVGARIGVAASPAYSASKAALETYGLALRSRLAADGVEVSVISPGFV